MKLALNDGNSKRLHRFHDCGRLVSGMIVTHQWWLYCSHCRQELQNPDHSEYYPKGRNGGQK